MVGVRGPYRKLTPSWVLERVTVVFGGYDPEAFHWQRTRNGAVLPQEIRQGKGAIPPRHRDEPPDWELGFSDYDCVRYVHVVMRKTPEEHQRALCMLWSPYGGKYVRGSSEERRACYWIGKVTLDVGLPKIPAWRVRLALRRAWEQGVLREQGNLHFPSKLL